MATYALIHGAGDSGFHWHLLGPKLRGRGHEVIAMDLPSEDESAGLAEYADAAVAAIGARAPSPWSRNRSARSRRRFSAIEYRLS